MCLSAHNTNYDKTFAIPPKQQVSYFWLNKFDFLFQDMNALQKNLNNQSARSSKSRNMAVTVRLRLPRANPLSGEEEEEERLVDIRRTIRKTG